MARKPTIVSGMMIHMVAMMMISCDAILFVPHNVHLHFRNDLGIGSNLNIHCKSKDDDLGPQVIAPGAVWGFGFRVSLWGNTLFYCQVEWPGSSHYFDAYIERRDACTTCFWGIRVANPCLLYKDKTVCYNWKSSEIL